MRLIKQKDLDSPELRLGASTLSITSSMAELIKVGVDTQSLFTIKEHIDGLSASLWAIMVMTIKAAHGDKEMELKVDEFDLQVNKQLEEIHIIQQDLDTQAKEYHDKHKSNNCH